MFMVIIIILMLIINMIIMMMIKNNMKNNDKNTNSDCEINKKRHFSPWHICLPSYACKRCWYLSEEQVVVFVFPKPRIVFSPFLFPFSFSLPPAEEAAWKLLCGGWVGQLGWASWQVGTLNSLGSLPAGDRRGDANAAADGGLLVRNATKLTFTIWRCSIGTGGVTIICHVANWGKRYMKESVAEMKDFVNTNNPGRCC